MARVTELGYLGLHISDSAAWKEFATEIVGMEWLDEGASDRFYLRTDNWHHRVTLLADGGDDLAFIGWRVAGADELDEMRAQLKRLEIPFHEGSSAECAERHVLELIKLEDPSGNPLEIFHGPHIEAAKPFYPGRRMHGRFVTGAGGLGHMIVRQDDVEKAKQFYTRALGMTGGVEYRMALADGHVVEPVFMHCNQRQHSVAFGVGRMQRRINHLMLETSSIDDVGMTYEIAQRRKVPIAVTLGKHSNDHMLSFYMQNPSGWLIEYGSGGRAPGAQSEYFTRDIWGHDRVGPGLMDTKRA